MFRQILGLIVPRSYFEMLLNFVFVFHSGYLIIHRIPLSSAGSPSSEGLYQPMWLPEGCELVDGKHSTLPQRAICLEDACSCRDDSTFDCCLVPGLKKTITFYCNLTATELSQEIVVSCDCVPCIEREVALKGSVISSINSSPVPLAALMLKDTVLGITNMEGEFDFSFKTKHQLLKIIIVEPNHKQGEISVQPGHQELNVVLESLQNRIHITSLEKGFTIVLASWGGARIALEVADHAFTQEGSSDLYRGPGSILHAVYQSTNPPNFYTKALNHMVYMDTRGVSFGIESILMGSLDMISDQGFKLPVRTGSQVAILVNITSQDEPSLAKLQKLHFYTCDSVTGIHQCWRDLGPVKVVGISGKVVSLAAFLRYSVDFWAIGAPVRSECFVKVIGVETGTQIRLPGMQVILEQHNDFEGFKTFSRQTQTTSANGTCLQTGCRGGGTIAAHSAKTSNLSIDHGLTWSSNVGQIKFYLSEFYDAKQNILSPYYRSREECQRTPFSQETAFIFILQPPSHGHEKDLLMQNTKDSIAVKPGQARYCYVKVAINDCLPVTDVQTFSVSKEGVGRIHTSIARSRANAGNTDDCYSEIVDTLQSACVEYTCGSTVRIAVKNRPKYTRSKVCRFVGTSLLFPSHVQHGTKSYRFVDQMVYSTANRDVGLYSSTSRQLALMKCLSGSVEHSSTVMDHNSGYGVMFTCLF